MSAFQTFPVVIKRKIKAVTATADTIHTEADIPGSPFIARLYRRRERYDRDAKAPGVAILDDQRILSLPLSCPVQKGDRAFLPAVAATNNQAEIVTIRLVRPYSTGLQCDLESGAENPDAPKGP